MATQKRKTSRKCIACREVTLHELDGHSFCLSCLGSAHDPFTGCDHCDKLPSQLRDIRVALIAETMDQGRLSVDWLERIRSVENLVWSNTNPRKSNTKRSNIKSKELVTSSSSEEEENENEGEKQEKNTSPKKVVDSDKVANTQGDKNILSPNVPVDSNNLNTAPVPVPAPAPGPSTSSGLINQDLVSWQAGIDQTVGALSTSLNLVLAKLEQFTKVDKKVDKKHKSKKTKTKSKSKDKGDSDSVQPRKKRRVSETAPNPEYQNQNESLSLPTELGYDLQEYGAIPPPPHDRIPRRKPTPTPTESDITSNIYDSDSDESQDFEIDLGRKDKRKLYLQSLQTLVPSLRHDRHRETQESGHFSLISQRPTLPKMPFLDEVFDTVAQTSTHQHLSNMNKKPFVKKMKVFYPTTEPAESGLLVPRKVPQELIHHVPQSKMFTSGTSDTLLSKHTTEGVKEKAALQSFNYSSAAIRLSNNMEIGVEAQGSLIKRCASSLEKMKEVPDLPRVVLNQIGSLNNSLALMKQSMFDLKAANNDLLQLALGQFNDSLVQRREAWLAASDIPKNMQHQLKFSDMQIPSPTDPKGPLPMFAQKDMNALKEHTSAQKDSAIIRLCTQRSRGRGQQGRSRPPRRGFFSGGRGYQQPPFDQQPPRGRGRGRPSHRSRGSSFQRGNTQKRV